MRGLGYTLTETVGALFILTASFLVLTQLFSASMGYASRVQIENIASLLAEKKFAEIRAYVQNTPNPDWSLYNGVTTKDSDYPRFNITVNNAAAPLFSPCSSLEALYPLGASYPNPAPKVLQTSARKVEVTVSWGPSSQQSLSLVTLVGLPPPKDCILSISPSAPSVASGGTQDFTVTAKTSTGATIPDMLFTWYVSPRGGNGTIQAQSRDGQRATYVNLIKLPNGTWASSPGPVELVVRTVFRGQDVLGTTIVSNL